MIIQISSLMTAGFACEVLREHGVIDEESAELLEEGSESFVFADSNVPEAVIAEEKEEEVYYN